MISYSENSSTLSHTMKTEFLIQAIPCYLFILAFSLRYMAIKDLGFPKRPHFSKLLFAKIIFTLAHISVRSYQIYSALNHQSYWLYSMPYYSLLYLQFILVQCLSGYLLIYQYLKRLPDVAYCHHLFWFLSFVLSCVYRNTPDDPQSLNYNQMLLITNLALFHSIFYKQKTIRDSENQSARPLLFSNETESGLYHDSIQSNPYCENVSSEKIDFKFNTKLFIDQQGSQQFEFRVFLPNQLAHGRTSIYTLKKSIDDFITLSDRIRKIYGKKAPTFKTEAFQKRAGTDHLKMLNKYIKVLEKYMKKLGSKKLFWDTVLFNFLQINDLQKIDPKTGIFQPNTEYKGITNNNDQQSQLFQQLQIIDNYQSNDKNKINLQAQTEVEEKNCDEIQPKISLKLLKQEDGIIKIDVNSDNLINWIVKRKVQDFNLFLKDIGDGITDFNSLNKMISKRGVPLRVLFYFGYFKHTGVHPINFVSDMLKDNSYDIESIVILGSHIEIVDYMSIQYLDIQLTVIVKPFKRKEHLILQKSLKQIKKLVKAISSEQQKRVNWKNHNVTSSEYQAVEQCLMQVGQNVWGVNNKEIWVEFIADIKIGAYEKYNDEKSSVQLDNGIIQMKNNSQNSFSTFDGINMDDTNKQRVLRNDNTFLSDNDDFDDENDSPQNYHPFQRLNYQM